MLQRVISTCEMVLGVGTILLTFWGMVHFLDPFYPHTYPFAWYGLILFLDGFLWWKWGESLLYKRPWEFLTLLFWSAVLWFFFEIWNLRLQNWYYVGVSGNALWAHFESYLDFATVLPGMFLVYRVLDRLHFPRRLKTQSVLPASSRRFFPALGIVMIVLPLIYPDYCYPLVWGAFFFLLEPVCAHFGGHSLLREAEEGEWTTIVRLLVSGLVCGAFWELCNFGSLAKWIYTVPFFSQGKLFEMPYLGFIGFPPFCVECYVMTNAIYLLRNGKHWKNDRQRPTRFACPKGVYAAVALLGLVLSEWAYSQVDRHTVDSRAESVYQLLKDISPSTGRALMEAGWHYPVHVLKNWDETTSFTNLYNREMIRNRLELATLSQMGSDNAILLENAGVITTNKLANQTPDHLYHRLVALNQTLQVRKTPLLKRRVTAWINGAKRRSFVY